VRGITFITTKPWVALGFGENQKGAGILVKILETTDLNSLGDTDLCSLYSTSMEADVVCETGTNIWEQPDATMLRLK
jgi:hypothetical protein